ncbi:hypothetical protein GCM10017673_35720 [Streptosporangium violaceochromogenes]|nr:hypothetical protein GCM10017673_35720 [Streptosporangium violaceochromogenes]
MISDDFMRRQLHEYLARHGANQDDVLAEIDESLGKPVLVVASGSILQGFGNPSSDVDVYAVVDHEFATEFPMNSYTGDIHLDVNFLQASWVREAAAELAAETGPLCAVPDRERWAERLRRMYHLNRLVAGLALAGTDEWLAERERVREVFPARMLAWWKTETLRYATAARLLERVDPMPAAQALCDAFRAALNGVCAEAGHLYMAEKWVGAKLRDVSREDLVARLNRAYRIPVDAGEAVAYLALVSGWLEETTAAWELPEPWVTLWPAEGVERWRVNDRLLIHRYGLRGVEFPAGAGGVPPELPWTGRAGEVPEEHLSLIKEDLVWLSVTEHRP